MAKQPTPQIKLNKLRKQMTPDDRAKYFSGTVTGEDKPHNVATTPGGGIVTYSRPRGKKTANIPTIGTGEDED